ncbi:MAG: sulfatase-like hydrolase/transferase [Planctomycetota bacterium]
MSVIFRFALPLLLVALTFRFAAAQDQEDLRPNIVVLICDDLGYGDLECYGHPQIKTPNLNAMAEAGIKFTSFYSSAPVCSPSRVGLMTGRSPNRAGVYDWIPPSGPKAKPDNRDLVHMRQSEFTMPAMLKKLGYATCMSGKWHCNSKFNSDQQPQPGDAGFDHWFATQNNAAPSHANPTNFVRNGKPVGPLKGYSCQLVIDEALNWLGEKKQRDAKQAESKAARSPFFMYIAFHEPHEPIASPKKLTDEYEGVAENRLEAEYFANVANVDLAVGKLMSRLKELGEFENTLIVFCSDNGPETLSRYKRANRSYGRPNPLRGMKLWTTEAGFRVAGIMQWPAKIQSGQVIDAPVSALDLMPTFDRLGQPLQASETDAIDLSLNKSSGLPTDRQFDGVSLVPLMAGQPLKREKPLFWVYYNAINQRRAAMRHGKWKLLAQLSVDSTKRAGKLQNVHEGNAKQVKSWVLSDFQLYDMTDDIKEASDVWDSITDEERAKLKTQINQCYTELLSDSHVWTRNQ